MSRKLFAFAVTELHVIRLVCQKPDCGVVNEMTVQKLLGGSKGCVACGTPFSCPAPPLPGLDPFQTLAKSLLAIQSMQKQVEAEFILPDPS